MSQPPPKTGLLGGTFDPVHNAHLYIAARAREAADLDRVLLLPAATPPHKRAQHLTAAAHRLQMAKLAASTEPWLGVSDWELKHPGQGYTVDTLRALRAQMPDKLYFIIGGDSLMMLDQWAEPEGLLECAAFIAVVRPGYDWAAMEKQRADLLGRFGGEILLAAGEGIDLSSTEIRRLSAQGAALGGLVPAAVADYIAQNRLYQGEA